MLERSKKIEPDKQLEKEKENIKAREQAAEQFKKFEEDSSKRTQVIWFKSTN